MGADDGDRARGRAERVFRDFKRSVEETIPTDDARTRLDLGLAYADMGLLRDALHEFELVLETEPGNVRARAEITRVRLLLCAPLGSGPQGTA